MVLHHRIRQLGGSSWDSYRPNFVDVIQKEDLDDSEWTYWLKKPKLWLYLAIVYAVYYYYDKTLPTQL